MNFDAIVREWFYRLPKGYADAPYTDAELAVLNEVLSENGITLSQAKLEKEKFTEPEQMRNEVDQLDQTFNDAKPVDDLKEDIITLGKGDNAIQYQLDVNDIEKIKSYLTKDLKKEPFKPMARNTSAKKKEKRAFTASFTEDKNWQNFLVKAGYPEDWDGTSDVESPIISRNKMSKLYFRLYSIANATWTSKYIDNVIDRLFSANVNELADDLFSITKPPKEMKVPNSLLGLANMGTSDGGSKGDEVGRGEFAVPFLFDKATMGGTNADHDVTIDGFGWHVKEITSDGEYIRLGKSTYSKSNLSKILSTKVGMSGADLSIEARAESTARYGAINNLYQSVTPGKISIVEALNVKNGKEALLEIQNRLNVEMRDGIEDSAGVLFYQRTSGMFYFKSVEECTCGGGTQGAHTVGMPSTGPFEIAAYKGRGEIEG